MLTRPAVADVRHGPALDEVAGARAVADLLRALGQDVTDESRRGTPRRVAATCAELLQPRGFLALAEH
jgi:GTP cyclohydrolase I